LTERAAKIEAAAKPAHGEKGAGEIKLGNAGTHAKSLVTFNNVTVETPDVRAAPSVALGYSDQHLSQLNGADTPMQATARQFHIGDQCARGPLSGAEVNIQMQDTPLHKLSAGQKARPALLVLRLRHPNFYLLDEPASHLDIEGQEALEEDLARHEAACPLLSPDDFFAGQLLGSDQR